MGLSGLQWAGAPVQAHQTKPPNPVSNTPVVVVLPGARLAPAPTRARRDGVGGLEDLKAVGKSFPILAHAHPGAWIRRAAGGSTGSPTPTRRAAPRWRALAGVRRSVPVLGCTQLGRHGVHSHHSCTRNTCLTQRPTPQESMSQRTAQCRAATCRHSPQRGPGLGRWGAIGAGHTEGPKRRPERGE
jgi:hypothetical protein